jgi:hypothetical protein
MKQILQKWKNKNEWNLKKNEWNLKKNEKINKLKN